MEQPDLAEIQVHLDHLVSLEDQEPRVPLGLQAHPDFLVVEVPAVNQEDLEDLVNKVSPGHKVHLALQDSLEAPAFPGFQDQMDYLACRDQVDSRVKQD